MFLYCKANGQGLVRKCTRTTDHFHLSFIRWNRGETGEDTSDAILDDAAADEVPIRPSFILPVGRVAI